LADKFGKEGNGIMTRPNTGDLVIISMHEKGFPSADLYIGQGGGLALDDLDEGEPPDGFFTMKRGDTLEMASIKAAEKWPGATIMFAQDEPDEDDE